MQIPPAIIFINADIDINIQNILKSQLSITEVMSDVEFNNRIIADPNYAINVHLNNLRILVISQNLRDYTNRQLADVVLFVKQGMATVLKNNYGPPTLSLSIQRLNLFNLFYDINCIKFSFICAKCKCGCCCNCFKHLPVPLQQMLINPFDLSGVHSANCDNEYNNEDWINRK